MTSTAPESTFRILKAWRLANPDNEAIALWDGHDSWSIGNGGNLSHWGASLVDIERWASVGIWLAIDPDTIVLDEAIKAQIQACHDQHVKALQTIRSARFEEMPSRVLDEIVSRIVRYG